jgi:hypothetical protein
MKINKKVSHMRHFFINSSLSQYYDSINSKVAEESTLLFFYRLKEISD